MRLHHLSLTLLFALGVVRTARAQLAALPTRAFPLAVTPWIGLNSFGARWSVGGENASLGSSFGVGARLDAPLTRRLGVVFGAELAPKSAQATETPETRATFASLVAYRADVGLGWRFKPGAPIFFAFGGGIVGSSKGPSPGFNKGYYSPEGMVTIGYDRGQGSVGKSRWGFRFAIANYFVIPKAPSASDYFDPASVPSVKAKSVAHDWTVQLGARYTLGTR